MKILVALLLAISALTANAVNPSPADPGWPRQQTNEHGRLVYYQPQIDDWNFKEVSFRLAFAFTPKQQKTEVIGIVVMRAQTDVNVDDRDVVLSNFEVTETHFPSLAPDKAAAMDKEVRSFFPPGHTVSISLDRLVASARKKKPTATVAVHNDPPAIFVSTTPAILLNVDGEPKRADIADTNLGFVVNSNFPLFFEKGSPEEYYIYTGQQWLKSASMEGPWAPLPKLPEDFKKVASNPKWAEMKKPILSPSAKGKPPTIFYSTKPAEVILFGGQPAYANIPGTELSYATNTDADLLVYNPTKEYYYLAAGRWFKASDLKGPWTYTTESLPPDFSNIPPKSPIGAVLVSVPGTPEAEDAVLMAQVPTTATVDPKAAEKVKVSYTGDPEFKPIEGTSMEFATNTTDKVIKVGDVYYLCLQGVWFMSPNPTGPWTTAASVPKEIYSIPPSSPVYNVTYVTQTTSDGTIQSSYTAGYFGTFIAGAALGAILANGTGYYYPPYYGYPVGGYPVYYPYACTYGAGAYYNPYLGAYGAARGVYGPYGGAAYGAAYNPYTGTYARGATAYGPYGSRSVAEAYNPYTGNYAATRQGSSPYGSWGQSVVSNGNKSAYTQHYSNSKGTVATARTSTGGAAASVSTRYGDTAAAKTSSGNMYATHDGNVYKNTGNGWKSYDNGSWNPVTSSQKSSEEAQQREQSARQDDARQDSSRESGFDEANREAQNRDRGEFQSHNFDSFRGGGGGWGGGGRFAGGGGFGGGGFRGGGGFGGGGFRGGGGFGGGGRRR